MRSLIVPQKHGISAGQGYQPPPSGHTSTTPCATAQGDLDANWTASSSEAASEARDREIYKYRGFSDRVLDMPTEQTKSTVSRSRRESALGQKRSLAEVRFAPDAATVNGSNDGRYIGSGCCGPNLLSVACCIPRPVLMEPPGFWVSTRNGQNVRLLDARYLTSTCIGALPFGLWVPASP